MAGPLVPVKTQVAGISLDVNRQLNLGPSTLVFIVPDSTEVTGWRTVKTLIKGFNRVSTEENGNDSKTVVYKAIEKLVLEVDEPTLQEVFRMPEVHASCVGETLRVKSAEMPAPDKAQVFTIVCKGRTLRSLYFDKK